MLKTFRFTLLYISWMVVITLSSLFDLSEIDTGDVPNIPYADKGVHFIFYFFAVVLGILCLEERRHNSRGSKKVLAVVLGSIAYGALIEGLQWLMPFEREADIWDIVANSLGAITAGLLIQKYGSLNGR